MERETKKIITPNKIEIELKAWITAREKRSINSILLSGAEFGSDNNGEVNKNIKVNSSILNSFQDKQIEEIVVSVSGETDDVLNKCLELKSADFDCLLENLDKVFNPENDTKKK